MQGELESKVKVGAVVNYPQPAAWRRVSGDLADPDPVDPGMGPFEFWKAPYRHEDNGTGGWQSDDTPQPLQTPGDVNEDAVSATNINRFGHFSILNTQIAVRLLRSIPANRTAIQSLQASQILIIKWTTGVRYLPDMVVSHDGVLYRVTADHVSGSAPPGGNYAAATDATPVMLDAWNNPIIFVPAPGLAGVTFESAGTTQHRITSSGIKPDLNGDGDFYDTNELAPGGSRPFFASAGPDGIFTTGDDNIYSFEN